MGWVLGMYGNNRCDETQAEDSTAQARRCVLE
jgi:hypothetical protein